MGNNSTQSQGGIGRSLVGGVFFFLFFFFFFEKNKKIKAPSACRDLLTNSTCTEGDFPFTFAEPSGPSLDYQKSCVCSGRSGA